MEYYVCDYHTHQVLRGPWTSAQVVEFINKSDTPKKYCNMSRYLLAKEGVYPNNSAGNGLIAYHLAQSNNAWSRPCPECGFIRGHHRIGCSKAVPQKWGGSR